MATRKKGEKCTKEKGWSTNSAFLPIIFQTEFPFSKKIYRNKERITTALSHIYLQIPKL